MKSLRLSKRASADLSNIWTYTIAEFGEAQAGHYLSALEDGFGLIIDHPEIGKPADHVKAGYRAFAKDRHIIYYTITEAHIDVIGVLHERMDPLGQI